MPAASAQTGDHVNLALEVMQQRPGDSLGFAGCNVLHTSWRTSTYSPMVRPQLWIQIEFAHRTLVVAPCDEKTFTGILQASDQLITEDLDVTFESLCTWDLGQIAEDIAQWLSEPPSTAASATRIGILASSTFQQLVLPFLGESLSKYSRLLLEVSFILSSHGHQTAWAGCTFKMLLQVRSFAGTKVLQGLDAALRHFFDNPSGDQGRALVLVLFVAIIAVTYYRVSPCKSRSLISKPLFSSQS